MTNEQAMRELRSVLDRVGADSSDEHCREAARTCAAKEAVIARYAPTFSSENLDKLTADEFRSFLLTKNNQHWHGLARNGGRMTADMPRLREAIRLLVDENVPLRTRLNRLRPSSGEPMVKYLGPAVITPILQIMYPDRYGVVKKPAEAAMKRVGLWAEMPRGTSFGESYEAENLVLIDTAAKLEIDLWTLDMLWWLLKHQPSPAPPRSRV